MVHCPFPCDVLVMYQPGTLVLAPSVMLEGCDLPGNPRKVGTRGWPNRRRPNPTSLCWKGMASLRIPGRLRGVIGQTLARLLPPQPN